MTEEPRSGGQIRRAVTTIGNHHYFFIRREGDGGANPTPAQIDRATRLLADLPRRLQAQSQPVEDRPFFNAEGGVHGFRRDSVLARLRDVCGDARDDDPETVARLVEFAQAGNRADFDWLARSAGVPAGELDAMWQGTCQRVRRDGGSDGPGMAERLRPSPFEFARLRLDPDQLRGDRITISRLRRLALPEDSA